MWSSENNKKKLLVTREIFVHGKEGEKMSGYNRSKKRENTQSITFS